MSFHHNEYRVYDLCYRGLLQEALEFVRSLRPEERRESIFFDYAEANLLAQVGAYEESLSLLKALCDGAGWIDPELLVDDPDFRPLFQRSGFDNVAACFRERMNEDARRARATKTVLYPSLEPGGQRLLLILHGDNSCAAHTLESWACANEAGWSVVALQSGELGAFAGAYRWNSYQAATLAVEEVLFSLQVDPTRSAEVILGGFSRGGEVALRLALDGVGPVNRAVAVCPAPMEEPELLAPGPDGTLRECYIFAGERDAQFAAAEAASRRLSALGVSVRLDRRAEQGHEYPEDFSSTLVRFLRESESSPSTHTLAIPPRR